MRRTLVAALLALTVAPAAFAGPIMLGVHAGSSIPDLRDNGGNELSAGWSSRVGPFFGVSASTPVAGNWGLQVEFNYVPQGGKHNGFQAIDGAQFGAPAGSFVYANIRNEARLNYLEIPVLATFRLGGANGVHALVGPYAGILLSARQVTAGTATVYADRTGTVPLTLPASEGGYPLPPVDFGADTNIKSSINSFNWGFQAGLDTSRPLGRGMLTLDVRGGLGLSNIQKYPDQDGKNATGALVVALGYAFPVGASR